LAAGAPGGAGVEVKEKREATARARRYPPGPTTLAPTAPTRAHDAEYAAAALK